MTFVHSTFEENELLTIFRWRLFFKPTFKGKAPDENHWNVKMTDKVHPVEEAQLILGRAALVPHGRHPKGKTKKMSPPNRKCPLTDSVNRFSSTKPAFIPCGIQAYLGIFDVMKQVLSSCRLSPSPVNAIAGCRQNAFVTASQWNARLRPCDDDVPGVDRTLCLHLWLESTPS